MNILVVGNGGREHALAWRLANSDSADEVLVAPGNAGTALERGVENVPVAVDDHDGLVELARERGVGLVVIGPEAPLVDGLADRFDGAGIPCFGPSAAAARLEGSKAFAKDFMARHDIPTAAWGSFSDIEEALAFIADHGAPIVVKADGLAAGKGVIVAHEAAEAEAAVRDMLAGNAFGDAGHRVVIEEYLEGEEASFIAMVDGEHILPLATSQDHKAVGEGDTGPNTGGMGAYSPAPVLDDDLCEEVMSEVMQPTVAGMATAGMPFRGFLYAGLMVLPDGGIRVLEFNVRFGDPETQPVLARLRSDFAVLCLAGARGTLDEHRAEWDPRPALGVVMAAEGYPGSYGKGFAISGLDRAAGDDVKVFHAGTALDEDGRVVTAGGRVLCVVALGDDLAAAREAAYAEVDRIEWDGAFCRRDIGHRALERGSK